MKLQRFMHISLLQAQLDSHTKNAKYYVQWFLNDKKNCNSKLTKLFVDMIAHTSTINKEDFVIRIDHMDWEWFCDNGYVKPPSSIKKIIKQLFIKELNKYLPTGTHRCV